MTPGAGILNGRRILVVEDEAIESLMLEDLLTSAGAVVIGPSGTTVEALALIGQEEAIHCAILDVRLTDGMSVPVAEALSARGIPFVVTTAYSTLPAPFDGAAVLRKVFLAHELVEAIADILRP